MRSLRVAVPDLVSPSYFPAIAAVKLGCLNTRGLDAELSLVFPVTDAVDLLAAGELDFVAGAAHTVFRGAGPRPATLLLAALSQHMYWFLVVRHDLEVTPGKELECLRGLRVGAAPGPDEGLFALLAAAGVDPASVRIGPAPAAADAGNSFGVIAAEALRDGKIDAFWANGMGAELAVREGYGQVLVDARRGGGPAGTIGFTFAALMTNAGAHYSTPAVSELVVDAVVEAQKQLAADPGLATQVASELFPARETELIATLVARDAPFYDASIPEGVFADVARFAHGRGSLSYQPRYDQYVPTAVRTRWSPR